MDSKFRNIPSVDIENGIFKYVLINVYLKQNTNESEEMSKKIVRGYKDCEYHADIYDRFRETLDDEMDTECLGGGRIEHNPQRKLIKVYGYSQGFGKADHRETQRILLTKYADYDIEISDSGY